MPGLTLRSVAVGALAFCICAAPCVTQAARARLKDNGPRQGWIDNVHEPIRTRNVDRKALRLIILKGMWNVKSYSWYLESETPDSIVARFDYRHNSIVMKVVYDENHIQLLYAGSIGFECTDLKDGVCLDNDRSYYNYSKNLRTSIARELKAFRRRK